MLFVVRLLCCLLALVSFFSAIAVCNPLFVVRCLVLLAVLLFVVCGSLIAGLTACCDSCLLLFKVCCGLLCFFLFWFVVCALLFVGCILLLADW